MSYYMKQRESQFFIQKDNYKNFYNSIVNVYNRIKTSPDEILCDLWRWDVFLDEFGNINDINFAGNKMWDDELFFQEIAPFVENNSYIEMEGSDGVIWRWVFNNGEVYKKLPNILWD